MALVCHLFWGLFPRVWSCVSRLVEGSRPGFSATHTTSTTTATTATTATTTYMFQYLCQTWAQVACKGLVSKDLRCEMSNPGWSLFISGMKNIYLLQIWKLCTYLDICSSFFSPDSSPGWPYFLSPPILRTRSAGLILVVVLYDHHHYYYYCFRSQTTEAVMDGPSLMPPFLRTFSTGLITRLTIGGRIAARFLGH